MDKIDSFFSNADEREPDLRELDKLICETVPDVAADRQILPGMAKQMMSYGMFHYVYASGREGDWPVIALANQKNYISLYVMAVGETGYMAEAYGDRLGKVDVGKSCIRFKKLDDLNLDEVRNILRDAEAWWRQQPKPGVQ
jgi:hypothetical protein